jgi:hypothetical protein
MRKTFFLWINSIDGGGLGVMRIELAYAHSPLYIPVMKLRKNLSLSPESVARGRQLAAEAGKSLSAVIEAQLLAAPSAGRAVEDYWPGPALKPLSRPGDPRSAYLKRKHGS